MPGKKITLPMPEPGQKVSFTLSEARRIVEEGKQKKSRTKRKRSTKPSDTNRFKVRY